MSRRNLMVNIHNLGHRNKASIKLVGTDEYTIHLYPDTNFSPLWESGDIITVGSVFTVVPRAFNATQQTPYDEAVASEMALHLATFYDIQTASYFWDAAKAQWVIQFKFWNPNGIVDFVEVYNTDGERIITQRVV